MCYDRRTPSFTTSTTCGWRGFAEAKNTLSCAACTPSTWPPRRHTHTRLHCGSICALGHLGRRVTRISTDRTHYTTSNDSYDALQRGYGCTKPLSKARRACGAGIATSNSCAHSSRSKYFEYVCSSGCFIIGTQRSFFSAAGLGSSSSDKLIPIFFNSSSIRARAPASNFCARAA